MRSAVQLGHADEFHSNVQGGDFANPSASDPLVGDVNHDCMVNIRDAAIIAYAYDSTPASSRWNPAADLNHDGIVSIIDAAILAFNFGQKVLAASRFGGRLVEGWHVTGEY